MKKYILKKQLKEEVLSDRELAELLAIVEELETVPLATLSNKTKLKIKVIAGEPSKVPRITFWSLAGSFSVFVVLLVAAQYATPGTPLYGIKQGSDYIRALIQPSYKETVIKNEKKELEKLEQNSMPSIQNEQPRQEQKNETRRDDNSRDTRNNQKNNDTRRDGSSYYDKLRLNNNRSDGSRSDSLYDNDFSNRFHQ